MLTCIQVVIQVSPALSDLEAHFWVISSLLGLPRNLTLSEACSMDSTKLLEWIWVSSCTSVADRVPQWTLCNFLRSDPHYYRFQFARSLQIAATRGDLMVVRWLLAHFSGCEVPPSVIEAAAEKGHLQVVELLWTHSYGVDKVEAKKVKKQKSTADGSANQAQSVSEEDITSICWRTMRTAADNGHANVVRWLCTNISHDMTNVRCVLDYADECPRVEVIEWMMECGYLRRDARLAGCAICDLADSGRLDLMQQIAQEHFPLPREFSTFGGFWSMNWSDSWYDALLTACKCGELPSVQWLLEHPMGIKIRERIQDGFYRENVISVATREGHGEVAKYLCEQKIRCDYGPALLKAISGNHLCCVKVMIEQYLQAGRRPEDYHGSVIEYAAHSGRLEIVPFLHNFTSQDAQRITQQGPVCDAWWSKSRGSVCMDAARSGNLELVKWSYRMRLDEGGEDSMECVAGAGHLEVLKWLHSNTAYRCTQHALDCAAMNGHLAVAQWLHTNRSDSESECCREDTMDWVVINGHLDVAKWMYANRLGRCTLLSIKDVTIDGPLQLAHWIRERFRDLVPPDLTAISSSYANKFEMLLFQHAHYPRLMSREIMQTAVRIILKYWPPAERRPVLDWIGEHFEDVDTRYNSRFY